VFIFRPLSTFTCRGQFEFFDWCWVAMGRFMMWYFATGFTCLKWLIELELCPWCAIWQLMDTIARFLIMARLKNVISVKRVGILLRTVPSGENVEMRSDRSPLPWLPPIAATPGPPELPVDPENNQTGEAIEFDSLVNWAVLDTPVLSVEFVPASVVS